MADTPEAPAVPPVTPEKAPRKKLVFMTDRQTREMYERWDTGRYTQLELANWYGVTDQTIRNMLQKREQMGPAEKEAVVLYDALDLKNLEDSLGTIAMKISRVIEKCPDERLEHLPQLVHAGKFVLNIRKQLKELPKDLHDRAAIPIDRDTTRKMIALIPPEKQEEYLALMRGLAQAQGQPAPDLGRKVHAERKKPKEEEPPAIQEPEPEKELEEIA